MDRAPQVAIVADDLIWATRLERLVRDAGADPSLLRTAAALERALAAGPRPDGVIVDLTSRAYDGVAAVARATAAGSSVVAVGQHDDRAAREAARAAGASEVYAYGRLFATGPAVIAGWVRGLDDGPGTVAGAAARSDAGAHRP